MLKLKFTHFFMCLSLYSGNINGLCPHEGYTTVKGGRIDIPNICEKCYGKKNELQTPWNGHRRPHQEDDP